MRNFSIKCADPATLIVPVAKQCCCCLPLLAVNINPVGQCVICLRVNKMISYSNVSVIPAHTIPSYIIYPYYTIKIVLAVSLYVTDDAIARLYVTKTLVK